jgi:hypothetical protein
MPGGVQKKSIAYFSYRFVTFLGDRSAFEARHPKENTLDCAESKKIIYTNHTARYLAINKLLR